jgi:hypothetical protein
MYVYNVYSAAPDCCDDCYLIHNQKFSKQEFEDLVNEKFVKILSNIPYKSKIYPRSLKPHFDDLKNKYKMYLSEIQKDAVKLLIEEEFFVQMKVEQCYGFYHFVGIVHYDECDWGKSETLDQLWEKVKGILAKYRK